MLNERERKIERKFKKDEKGKGTIWRRMRENKNQEDLDGIETEEKGEETRMAENGLAETI